MTNFLPLGARVEIVAQLAKDKAQAPINASHMLVVKRFSDLNPISSVLVDRAAPVLLECAVSVSSGLRPRYAQRTAYVGFSSACHSCVLSRISHRLSSCKT
jgi:uncharacterized protein (UPF0261 family)